jgi:hypothetical protein
VLESEGPTQYEVDRDDTSLAQVQDKEAVEEGQAGSTV